MIARPAAGGSTRWRMLGTAFVAYNVGLTVVLTTFGPALPVLQVKLGASRGAVSLAMGLLIATMGLLAPVVGTLALRVGLRTLMLAGATLDLAGYLLLSLAHNVVAVVLLYGLVLGLGACLLSVVPGPTLISRWFVEGRGKALSIGLLQIAGLVAAPAAAWLIVRGGTGLLFLTLAGLFALLLPIVATVVEHPPAATAADVATAAVPPVASAPAERLLANGRFWLLSLVIGIYSGGGVLFPAHAAAMAVEKGIDPAHGALLISGLGGGTIVGALAFGWLMDTFGPFRALVVGVACAMLVWLAFAQTTSLAASIMLGAALGASLGPSVPLHSACMGEIVAPESFSRAIGYSYLLKLPFLAGAAPLAGWLFDLSHGYRSTYVVLLISYALALVLAIALARLQRDT